MWEIPNLVRTNLEFIQTRLLEKATAMVYSEFVGVSYFVMDVYFWVALPTVAATPKSPHSSAYFLRLVFIPKSQLQSRYSSYYVQPGKQVILKKHTPGSNQLDA